MIHRARNLILLNYLNVPTRDCRRAAPYRQVMPGGTGFSRRAGLPSWPPRFAVMAGHDEEGRAMTGKT
jgi:hypothetical protein